MRESTGIVNFGFLLLITASCLAAADAFARQQTFHVATADELERAVVSANRSGGYVDIVLARGTYTLSHTLEVLAPHVTLEGPPGARASAIVQGDSMSASARVGNLIRVAGAYFILRDMTLRRSRWHLIQIAGEDGAEAPVIRDCILEDSYEQMLKVSVRAARPQMTSDGGLVENCTFQYTAGVGPEFYIGGIDAHGAKHWTVRNNVFRDIASPSRSVAEFAVHFWDGSADDLIERNLIIDCDRGIGFGLKGKPNRGGIIRNNMIYHAPGAGFADVGIALADSPGTRVYANTVFLESDYPRAIEYRFPDTRDVLIADNLTNRDITSQTGATGRMTHNVIDASADWFVGARSGDLRLAHSVPGVTRAGLPIPDLATDFAGRPRPAGRPPDIGADQESQ
jgi:hypothetical protein